MNTRLSLSLGMLVVYTCHHAHIDETDERSCSENPRVTWVWCPESLVYSALGNDFLLPICFVSTWQLQ